MYKGFVVDRSLLASDPHLREGCVACHRGNAAAADKASAHRGMVRRPSDEPAACAACHPAAAKTYSLALHYTTAGMKTGVRPRFSQKEAAVFDAAIFEQSCRSCHASCGDCHVKSPVISGVNTGLIKGHAFVRKDESKTCSLCHGGRVYPEFTGEYGGNPDVHYQKGMSCVDCHPVAQMHGDGSAPAQRKAVTARPSCVGCHPAGSEKTDKAKEAHADHAETASCSACHSSAAYRGCAECHLGEGATSNPQFILGTNPRTPGQLTTLRLVPTVRGTFRKAGIAQESFDALPNLWDTVPHNTRKRTERTRDCGVCHAEKANVLTPEALPRGGSEANKKLVFEFAY